MDTRWLQTPRLPQAYQPILLAGLTVVQEFTWFKYAILSSALSVHTGESIETRTVCKLKRRYVFERSTTYADSFVAVKSLKQVLGSRFKKLSWPQFVNMLLNNQLSSDPELQRLGVAHAARDAEGTTGMGVKDSRKVASANQTTVNHPEAWVTAHWAPYWFTCGPCHPSTSPSYILHMDRAEEDANLLLKELGLKGKMPSYPHALRLVFTSIKQTSAPY